MNDKQVEQEGARQRLIWASVLVNQAVGDALSDALFFEAVMITMHLSMGTVQSSVCKSSLVAMNKMNHL